jgi:uncharacterized membrane protein YoaK (UPF0700 family)
MPGPDAPPPATPDPAHAHRAVLTLAVLLTAGSGAMDAIGFALLGDVFTSVMTGNLVLLGVSVGGGDGELALRIGIAFATFVVGVMTAGRITGHHPGNGLLWPRRVTTVLLVQLVVLTLFVVGYQLEGAHPEGAPQIALLAVAALAMGLQSGAVVGIGVAGLSTTYVTGTLTGVLTSLAIEKRLRWDRASILIALVVGAIAAGLLIVHAPRLAPILPLLLLVYVIVAAWRSPHLARD